VPLSLLIVLGLFGIYLVLRGNAGVRQQAEARARIDADPDGATLDELARAGSDLTREHTVEFYLYFPTEASAESVALVLKGEGFDTDVHRIDQEPSWTLLASRRMKPEMAALRAARDRFSALVAEHGGEYDGWGTQVEGNDADD
jgi:hypothetical protein